MSPLATCAAALSTRRLEITRKHLGDHAVESVEPVARPAVTASTNTSATLRLLTTLPLCHALPYSSEKSKHERSLGRSPMSCERPGSLASSHQDRMNRGICRDVVQCCSATLSRYCTLGILVETHFVHECSVLASPCPELSFQVGPGTKLRGHALSISEGQPAWDCRRHAASSVLGASRFRSLLSVALAALRHTKKWPSFILGLRCAHLLTHLGTVRSFSVSRCLCLLRKTVPKTLHVTASVPSAEFT